MALTKEGAGVLSTVARHLAFLDSELVARSVSRSTFNPLDLLKRGTTLFLQIPPDQLEAQRGLLRCWLSALIRAIGSANSSGGQEVLFLVDEASAAGGLSALEETLVRGRSAGVRLLLAYQSDAQVRSAFKDKQTLLYDNCSTQIYLGASSFETAERISKSLGDWTQTVASYGTTESRSHQEGSYDAHRQGAQVTSGSSENYSVSGRALLRPEEVLTLDDNYLIAFVRSFPPILARRIKWYQEAAFTSGAVNFGTTRLRDPSQIWLLLLLAAALAVIAWVLYDN
jgi:type IV secretion system protein VirD4